MDSCNNQPEVAHDQNKFLVRFTVQWGTRNNLTMCLPPDLVCLVRVTDYQSYATSFALSMMARVSSYPLSNLDSIHPSLMILILHNCFIVLTSPQGAEKLYPNLFRLAMDILPAQVSLVPCERLFLSRKVTCTACRNLIQNLWKPSKL